MRMLIIYKSVGELDKIAFQNINVQKVAPPHPQKGLSKINEIVLLNIKILG